MGQNRKTSKRYCEIFETLIWLNTPSLSRVEHLAVLTDTEWRLLCTPWPPLQPAT